MSNSSYLYRVFFLLECSGSFGFSEERVWSRGPLVSALADGRGAGGGKNIDSRRACWKWKTLCWEIAPHQGLGNLTHFFSVKISNAQEGSTGTPLAV